MPTAEEFSAVLGVNLSNYPENWSIKDATGTIAIFVSDHPDLKCHSGTIVDYTKKIIVMTRDSVASCDDDPNAVEFGDDVKFLFPKDGTNICLFIYEGQVVFATAKSLNVVEKRGIPFYPKIYKKLGGVSFTTLFGQNESYPWFYRIVILSTETCLVSKLPYNSEAKIIYLGAGRLPYKTTEVMPPRFSKFEDLSISKKEALAIYNGDMTDFEGRKYKGCPYPDLLYTEKNGVMTKYESAGNLARLAVRGPFHAMESRFTSLCFYLQIIGLMLIFRLESFVPPLLNMVKRADYNPSSRLPLVLSPSPFSDPSTYCTTIDIISEISTEYKVNYYDNVVNTFDIVHRLLEASLSPLKSAELSAIKSDALSIVENVFNYQMSRKFPQAIPYSPAPLCNGYVPSLPKTTMEKMDAKIDCMLLGESVDYNVDPIEYESKMKVLIADCISNCDCTDYFHIMKHFCSFDISPPQDMKRYYESKYMMILQMRGEEDGINSPKVGLFYRRSPTSSRTMSPKSSSSYASPKSWSSVRSHRANSSTTSGSQGKHEGQKGKTYKKRIPGDEKIAFKKRKPNAD